MKLLLVDSVPGLGVGGEIVSVARGYARNYLLPKGLARVPTEQAIVEVRRKAAQKAAELEALKAERMALAQKLASAHVFLKAKASEEGHLYGSVGARRIVDALAEQGYEVEERQIDLDQPIKRIGDFDVTISLQAEVQVPVKVTVEPDEE